MITILSIIFLSGAAIFILLSIVVVVKNLFNEPDEFKIEDLDSTKTKVIIECPNCGDIYTINKTDMAGGGNGTEFVRCYKCNYEYKQITAIIDEE